MSTYKSQPAHPPYHCPQGHRGLMWWWDSIPWSLHFTGSSPFLHCFSYIWDASLVSVPTLILESLPRPYTAHPFLSEEKPKSWHHWVQPGSHQLSDHASCLFSPHSLWCSLAGFITLSLTRLCTGFTFPCSCMATSLMGFKLFMPHLLNEILSDHPTPTLSVLTILLFSIGLISYHIIQLAYYDVLLTVYVPTRT